MSTYCHVGQSICPLRISMGTLERHYVAPSIHHPTTSQAFNNMRTVSGYILPVYHCTYCLLSILVDIQHHILSSSDPVEISDTIDRRLDDFLLQFRV